MLRPYVGAFIMSAPTQKCLKNTAAVSLLPSALANKKRNNRKLKKKNRQNELRTKKKQRDGHVVK